MKISNGLVILLLAFVIVGCGGSENAADPGASSLNTSGLIGTWLSNCVDPKPGLDEQYTLEFTRTTVIITKRVFDSAGGLCENGDFKQPLVQVLDYKLSGLDESGNNKLDLTVAPGFISYSILKIDGSVLRMGHVTDQYDGSTPALRMRELNPEVAFTMIGL